MTSKTQHQSDRNQCSSVPEICLRLATAALGLAVVLLMAVMATPSAQAQTFTTLPSISFDGTDGASPYAALIQATDGNFYGTAQEGGANGDGTVFKITPSGRLTTSHNFDGTDGQYPTQLVQATDGNFYGTTFGGGTNGDGTVFKITPSGTLTMLYSFCAQANCTDGEGPIPVLVQATDGNFYGATANGGANNDGTVFKITPSGALTTLHSFDFGTDGQLPEGLAQGTDGNFYGTTNRGGDGDDGTVFKITPSGTLTTLHNFQGADGDEPDAGLVQGTDGNFYGTTAQGGANNDGTVFKITPTGTLKTLHSFDGTDGSLPAAALIQATDGNLYGTTVAGGTDGTLFKITPSGKLTTLHDFDGTDGISPEAALVQGTNGKFYGTAPFGGISSDGTVFSLSVGLGPFVKTQPTSGKVGAAVKILGTDLTGATSVTFNGTAAVFKVVSASLITTNMPTGATTGTVEVTTPRGTLQSNVVFRVTK
jgi:uncharacterized repeat protein (TIGR03803 family)